MDEIEDYFGTETFDREITTRKGTTKKIKIRRLNTGDEAFISDQMILEQGATGDDQLRPMLGRRRILTVQRALTWWELGDLTFPLIDQLDPFLFDQIHEHIDALANYTEEPKPVEEAPDPTKERSDGSAVKSTGPSAVAV